MNSALHRRAIIDGILGSSRLRMNSIFLHNGVLTHRQERKRTYTMYSARIAMLMNDIEAFRHVRLGCPVSKRSNKYIHTHIHIHIQSRLYTNLLLLLCPSVRSRFASLYNPKQFRDNFHPIILITFY